MIETRRLIIMTALAASLGRFAHSESSPPPAAAPVKEPVKHLYDGYVPDFVAMIWKPHVGFSPYVVPESVMRLSTEPAFYTLCRVPEWDRANALVEAAIQKEREGQGRMAIDIYQKVIAEYPDALFRVSPYGVFVPITHYCQLRILGLPASDLGFYRTKFDAQAKEVYETARLKNSREGLAEVRDRMLATSFGGRSMLTLGMSALDRGHYLEALEYFDQVWEYCPDPAVRGAELAMSMALCRKMLETGPKAGERYGLVAHWKLDETAGNKAADSSGYANDGTLNPGGTPPDWTPGKVRGAHHFGITSNTYVSNAARVPAKTFMDIGVGGADFSVAFWVNLDRAAEHDLFSKKASADETLMLHALGPKGQIRYTIATQSPTWETGITRGAVGFKRWAHVALVKVGGEVKVFLDGKLDLRDSLKAPALKNAAGVTFGGQMLGCLDDIRLYNRALLDREVAEFAGTLGAATMTASATSGPAPLAVDFAYPGAGTAPAARCFWEFGDGETATGAKVRHTYGLGGDYAAALTVTDENGAVSVARTKIVTTWPAKDVDFAKRMGGVLDSVTPEKPPWAAQLTSAPYVSADDYTLFLPTTDPMGLKDPVWECDLPASRNDVVVYTHPVVTARSVIYRHKNIIYCRSLLNGEVQWTNDIGGRVVWQSRHERQYPHDNLLVQDGLVFTPMHKVGPSLVALDEVTGELKWAYGPAVAATEEEALMRFEAAPAGGPRTVYAGYVLDNIQGETHTDSEYGVIAFESTTGRIKWRRELCRLSPGKFAAGFAEYRRNKIRSFTSPPLYHEGTVYYCSDAGVVAALDALSGQVKWLARYPYYPAVHDSTRVFGALPEWSGTVFTDGMHEPSFWFNQRPLLVGERLFVLPVNSAMMHCLDRQTGKVVWSRLKQGGNYTYLLGPTSDGLLVLATSGRGDIVHLLDPVSGKTVWTSPDPIIAEDHPVMTYDHYLGSAVPGGFNNRGFFLVARPFLTSDDRVCTTYFIDCGFGLSPWCVSLAQISLKDRKIVDRRRYYVSAYQVFIGACINRAKATVKEMADWPPAFDDKEKNRRRMIKDISEDSVPENQQGPFLPFARVTAERHGTLFELRITPRTIAMLYDREAVSKNLAARTDAEGLFATAELAVSDARLEDAAELMKRTLASLSSEDLDFRAVVNQQLHLVYKRLAQSGVRRGQNQAELAGCVGMSQTANTLAEEMESLLALSEACERQGNWKTAAQIIQSLVNTYGRYEYPIPSVLAGDADRLLESSRSVLDRSDVFVKDSAYGKVLGRSAMLSRKMLGLYFSALSPLKPDLRVRAGELGATRLIRLQQAFPELRQAMEKQAEEGLAKWTVEEQLLRLWEYPATAAARKVVDGRLADMEAQLKKQDLSLEQEAELRRREWMLADAARIGGLTLPDTFRRKLLAPVGEAKAAEVKGPMFDRTANFDDERGPEWLLLERKGHNDRLPDAIFLGGRVKKRLDRKFLLSCIETTSGKLLWKAQEKRGDQWFDEIRLGAKGDEPGFSEAFVYDDLVVVHGMYDVLAFGLDDGKLRWRYVVPHTFEIRHALMSGDLLMLAGGAETVALYLGTRDPRGEAVWQKTEEGDPYAPLYFHGDRLVEVRKMPSNLTVRYRSTGELIGRLALPDLLLHDDDPLIDGGPRALPIAHDGKLLAVTDGWYYIMVDVEKMTVMWKRLIDANDVTRLPPMRFELNGEYLAVVKQDYDVKAIYMLSSSTGEVLWRTDPKAPGSPYPIHSMYMHDGRLYGIKPHLGQGFYLAGMDCKTGRELFPPTEQAGYGARPECALRRDVYGNTLVVALKDRQDFELKAFDAATGKLVHTVKVKGTGDFGVPGCASATVQNGSLALMGKNTLVTAVRK